MSNPVLDIIEQVPKGERLAIARELKRCYSTSQAIAVAEKHGIPLTKQQASEIKGYLTNNPPEEELRAIVMACVPEFMVGPTMVILKNRLGR